MDILLSIKPKYADAILNGSKQYEFRRKIFKRKNINKVYMYSTSPIKKIVGTFTVGEIIEDHPRGLWKRCQNKSGINEAEFFNYFDGVGIGYAIKIKDLERIREPVDPRSIFPNFTPPQSFCYCDVI
jgi:type I restriction enzyme S subunit